MRNRYSLESLPDDTLITCLSDCVSRSNEAHALVLAHIAEVDSRKLYLREGASSMFTYCVEVLRLAEGAAYKRIAAARAARSFPLIFECVADGRLHLSAVKLLAPHLREENHASLLGAAAGKSVRQLQVLIAERFPQPDAPSRIRRLPRSGTQTALPAQPSATPPQPETPAQVPAPRPAKMTPSAAQRYTVQFTAQQALYDKLRRAQQLLGHAQPGGDLAGLIERALDVLLPKLEARKLGRSKAPRTKPSAASSSEDVTGNAPVAPDPIHFAIRHRAAAAAPPVRLRLPGGASLAARAGCSVRIPGHILRRARP